MLLVTWRHWVPAFLAVGFGLSTLTAFVLAATVGLFGVEEGWTGWAVWTAAAAEVVAVVAGARLLLGSSCADNPPAAHARSRSTRRPSVVRTSTRAMSARGVEVAAGTCMVVPPTDRQLPTCSVRPSRVRTKRR